MAYTLTIDGTVTDIVTNKIEPNLLHLDLDEPDMLCFTRLGGTSPCPWHDGQVVTLDDGTTPRFSGEIASIHAAEGEQGWTYGITCLGLKYRGNKIPVTNAHDGTGEIVYNLPTTDVNYISTNSNLTVATMLDRLFTDHAAALAAHGIAGYVSGDLTATDLLLVPPTPVSFSGPSFFNAIDSFLDQWAGNFSCHVRPVFSGGVWSWKIRVQDPNAFSITTLTLNSDPIDWPEVVRDATNTFTRVEVRGYARVECARLSTQDGSLTAAWSGAQQTAWSWNSYAKPSGAMSKGTISSLTSTSATVASSNAAETWTTNQWSNADAAIFVKNATSTSITFQEVRQISSNTALSAGGSATVSWTNDAVLSNAGYTTFEITARPAGTTTDVWRRYNIANTYIAQHLVAKFPVPVWAGSQTQLISLSYPAGFIFWNRQGGDTIGAMAPGTIQVDPVAGQVVFLEPVVKTTTTQANLNTGGASVTAPDEVVAYVAYSRGAMSAFSPLNTGSTAPNLYMDGTPTYGGTGYTEDGITETFVYNVPGWLLVTDRDNMQLLADMLAKTMRDTVVSGSVLYHDKYAAALDLNQRLCIAGNGFTTGWESLNCPVRAVTLVWPPRGPELATTTLTLNNRRRQGTGEAMFVHPAFSGAGGFGGQDAGSLLVGGMVGGMYGTVATGDYSAAMGADVSGVGVDATDPGSAKEWASRAMGAGAANLGRINAQNTMGGMMSPQLPDMTSLPAAATGGDIPDYAKGGGVPDYAMGVGANQFPELSAPPSVDGGFDPLGGLDLSRKDGGLGAGGGPAPAATPRQRREAATARRDARKKAREDQQDERDRLKGERAHAHEQRIEAGRRGTPYQQAMAAQRGATPEGARHADILDEQARREKAQDDAAGRRRSRTPTPDAAAYKERGGGTQGLQPSAAMREAATRTEPSPGREEAQDTARDDQLQRAGYRQLRSRDEVADAATSHEQDTGMRGAVESFVDDTREDTGKDDAGDRRAAQDAEREKILRDAEDRRQRSERDRQRERDKLRPGG